MPSLNGRVALVTGASGEIGAAIARALTEAGAVLALHGAGPELIAALQGAGAAVHPFEADLADGLAAQRMVDEVYKRLGRLDILVNAYAETTESLLMSLTPEEWQGTFSRNVNATFYVIQAAARYMLLDRRGRIVNVSGLAASRPGRGQLADAAAKGALNALTRALAIELAPKQITVNAVAPGAIRGATVAAGEAERVAEAVPLRRLGAPQDVAEIVAFLASDEASYVTGEVFTVDGGLGGRR